MVDEVTSAQPVFLRKLMVDLCHSLVLLPVDRPRNDGKSIAAHRRDERIGLHRSRIEPAHGNLIVREISAKRIAQHSIARCPACREVSPPLVDGRRKRRQRVRLVANSRPLPAYKKECSVLTVVTRKQNRPATVHSKLIALQKILRR